MAGESTHGSRNYWMAVLNDPPAPWDIRLMYHQIILVKKINA
jgi:hypothetical protein